jgi:predicted membrane-bound spermidine synthase
MSVNGSAMRVLFLVSFLEGGALMATEIAGARLVAPFYGNSLYVWAAVLGLTLTGLAGGYFLGAALSKRSAPLSILHGVLLLAALFVAIMPWSAAAIMSATLGLDLRLGITVSCLVFLVPPLVCFGTVSPLIIDLLGRSGGMAGHMAGKVYAISTLGGIVATLAVALWTIPEIGLWQTLSATALLTAVIPTLYFCGVPALRLAPAASR